MYGLAVIEVMTMSGHLSNIDEIRGHQNAFSNIIKIIITLSFVKKIFVLWGK